MRIRVVLADDDALLRAGVGVVLGSAPDIEVVGEAADGVRAVEVCRELTPHVVAAVKALDEVTLEFGQGQFTAVMGPSGSGKSTLLQCAAGDPPRRALRGRADRRARLGDRPRGPRPGGRLRRVCGYGRRAR